ncbi:hypothetical protein [Ruminococcus sp.]|jgi:hypothetical protein|uniref:hypothetical protein n=1 Tax=Ruminococcus sp. TaxID=41978 RepID=UPI0025D7CBAC|nr:hypothetical protein [Ruminococcus sp.]
MKKVIKKISAIAMAFTLLGTGTTFTKNNKVLEAKAASPRSCPVCHGNQTGVCEAGYWWGFGCSITNDSGQKYYYLLCGTCGAHTGFWA